MVASQPNPIHLVSDEDSSKRRQILDGARKVFLDLGFDGASMGEIARAPPASPRARSTSISPTRTSCSRRSSRRNRLRRARSPSISIPRAASTTTLPEFGRAYIQLLCRPGGGSAIRTVMSIAGENAGGRPPLLRQRLLARTVNQLCGLSFRRGAGGRPRDRRPRARRLAIHADIARRRCSRPSSSRPKPAPTAEQITTVVDSATRVFLSAYSGEAVTALRRKKARCSVAVVPLQSRQSVSRSNPSRRLLKHGLLRREGYHRASPTAGRRWLLAMTEWFDSIFQTTRGCESAFSLRCAPEVCIRFGPPSEKRAQGSRCATTEYHRVQFVHEKGSCEHTWSSGGNPAFLRDGFTVSFVLSPVTGLSCHRRSAEADLHELSASIGAPGPHDFAVRDHATLVSRAASASTASHRTFVTIASRPSCRVRRASW